MAVALCVVAWWGGAAAQPIARAQEPAPPPQVGVSEIFDALTRPDAPTDLQRLRFLRDSLIGNPDQKTLAGMRGQIDSLLRDAEHRQGELPPALVMSGIASRIDTAMTKLENAHPSPSVMPLQSPPWLLPSLAALSGTLAIGLALCLAALVAQSRSAEDSDDMRESLARMRRKLEEVASGARKTREAQSELEDGTETLQETGVSISRLNSSAKEAETLLRASSEAAEQRLQGAVAVASQLETWLEELPVRLNIAIARATGSEPEELETAAQMADSAFLLPGFLSTLQEACDEMRITTEGLAQANLAAAQPMTDEIGEIATLASEMTHLAFGHVLRVDDVVGQLMQATAGLPELGRILEEATAQLPQQIARHVQVTDDFAAAGARAEAAWNELGRLVAERLPPLLAEATLPLARLADVLPEAGTSLVASSEAFKRHVLRDTKRENVTRAAIGEISAAAQSARADLAAAADAVAAMPAQNDRLCELLAEGEQLIAGLQATAAAEADELARARNEALSGVEMAIGKMQVAAERLNAGADAQEQALARVRRAALTVATLAGADPGLDDATPGDAAPSALTG